MGAPPIVLLHGVGLDRTVWSDVEHQITGRPTIALDLPGHGQQPALTASTTLAALSDDVVGRMPDGPVHLVGFSLGALIAEFIASHYPGRVLSLTCVSSVCGRTVDERESVRHRLHTARTNFRLGMERAAERWFPADNPTDRRRRTEILEVLLANDTESYVHAYEVFAEGDQEIAEDLPRISAPTIALTGELDPGSTPEMTERLAGFIPGSRSVIVPGARHMLPIETPEVLVESISAQTDATEGAHHG